MMEKDGSREAAKPRSYIPKHRSPGDGCHNCAYWMQSECRARAPLKTIKGDEEGRARFPVTYSDDWCGDHALRGFAASREKNGLTPRHEDTKAEGAE